jgi:hypothetical protein
MQLSDVPKLKHINSILPISLKFLIFLKAVSKKLTEVELTVLLGLETKKHLKFLKKSREHLTSQQ